jgi:hypothetical protein
VDCLQSDGDLNTEYVHLRLDPPQGRGDVGQVRGEALVLLLPGRRTVQGFAHQVAQLFDGAGLVRQWLQVADQGLVALDQPGERFLDAGLVTGLQGAERFLHRLLGRRADHVDEQPDFRIGGGRRLRGDPDQAGDDLFRLRGQGAEAIP